MTGTVTAANPRTARWLVADGCPRPGVVLVGGEHVRMPSYAKRIRLRGRSRVPR